MTETKKIILRPNMLETDFLNKESKNHLRNGNHRTDFINNKSGSDFRKTNSKSDFKNNESDKFRAKILKLEKSKKFGEALGYCDLAIDKFPLSHYFYFRKSVIYQKMANYEKSLEFIDEAIYLKDNKYYYLYQKGIVLGELERTEEALKYLEKSFEICPKNKSTEDFRRKCDMYIKIFQRKLKFNIKKTNSRVTYDNGVKTKECMRIDGDKMRRGAHRPFLFIN